MTPRTMPPARKAITPSSNQTGTMPPLRVNCAARVAGRQAATDVDVGAGDRVVGIIRLDPLRRKPHDVPGTTEVRVGVVDAFQCAVGSVHGNVSAHVADCPVVAIDPTDLEVVHM